MSTVSGSWVVAALIIGAIGGYALSNVSETPKNAQSMVTTSPLSANATDAEKIQNAMSAAPEAIARDATILDWPTAEGDDFRTLRTGSNAWSCVPDYPASPGNDPFCGDQMSFAWFGAYMSKKTPEIAQAGIGYMLQGGSDPSNTDPFASEPKEGESWMSAPPHLMIFPIGKLETKNYGTDAMSGKPWIMWADTPYAHLMVPVQ